MMMKIKTVFTKWMNELRTGDKNVLVFVLAVTGMVLVVAVILALHLMLAALVLKVGLDWAIGYELTWGEAMRLGVVMLLLKIVLGASSSSNN